MSITEAEINEDLKGIAAGITFAVAYAWIDVVRKTITQFVPIPSDSLQYYLLIAFISTVLSILIMALIRNESKKRQKKALRR
jgi:fructose-specific phosphotransferase system IIC component